MKDTIQSHYARTRVCNFNFFSLSISLAFSAPTGLLANCIVGFCVLLYLVKSFVAIFDNAGPDTSYKKKFKTTLPQV